MEVFYSALFLQWLIGFCFCYEEIHGQTVPANENLSLQVERSQRFLENPTDVHIFVSPGGSDALNNGLSTGKPIKSIKKAVSLLPKYKGHNVYIELFRGYHDLDSTLQIHHTETSKLTIRAYNGQEVHVTGGVRLDSKVFKPVPDQHTLSRLPAVARSHVRVAHLATLNITNYGHIHRYGMYYHRVAPLEVFVNGEPMRLARWPNQDYINIVGLVDGEHGQSFRYNSLRPSTWKDENEIWAYGYWRWSWADRAIKVKSFNTTSMTVTLAEKTTFGLTIGHWNTSANAQPRYRQQGGYFRFFNVLSELDEPLSSVAQSKVKSARITGNHGNQATVNVNVVVPEPTAVVIKGRCTGCGGVLEENINICSAILVAILFFPFGLLCCLFMTERKCSRCGALYS